jgi:class 3 adenylate cyclase
LTVASGVACVLFTDLVGSTELMGRLGDARFDALRAEHFACLRQAVAAAGGSEVKTTGDGLLVTFASAVAALAGAEAAQQATDRHARRAEVPLSIRVGLALGEVVREDGDVFGTPVVEAARLVAAARPGQILCCSSPTAVTGSPGSRSTSHGWWRCPPGAWSPGSSVSGRRWP